LLRDKEKYDKNAMYYGSQYYSLKNNIKDLAKKLANPIFCVIIDDEIESWEKEKK
jgi:hypothetical protein